MHLQSESNHRGDWDEIRVFGVQGKGVFPVLLPPLTLLVPFSFGRKPLAPARPPRPPGPQEGKPGPAMTLQGKMLRNAKHEACVQSRDRISFPRLLIPEKPPPRKPWPSIGSRRVGCGVPPTPEEGVPQAAECPDATVKRVQGGRAPCSGHLRESASPLFDHPPSCPPGSLARGSGRAGRRGARSRRPGPSHALRRISP